MSVAVMDQGRAGPVEVSGAFLLARARAGDTAAHEELVRCCRRTAFAIALQLVGNREDALDVAQDAMIRFLSSLARVEPGRPVRPWLARIVVNLVRDAWRRQRQRRTDSLEEHVQATGKELVDPTASPEALAERAELRRRVARAVGELPAKSREILVLRDYQGLTYAEIASTLGIPVGTVMSRLHRARSFLREALGGLAGRQS